MRRPLPLLARIAVAVALAVFAGALAAPSPAQAFGPTFYADSGDRCPYGVTRGQIDWVLSNSSLRSVVAADLRGTLTDRPTPADPSTACANDGFYSVASYTAVFAGGFRVSRSVRADNATVTIGFRLGPISTTAELDRVEIQVCRHPLVTLPPSYCGRTQVYLAPELL